MRGSVCRDSFANGDGAVAQARQLPTFAAKEIVIATIAHPAHRAERTGLLFALAGFALLSVGDTIIKSMAGQWAPTAAAALRYTLGAIGLGVFALLREGPAILRVPLPRLQALRGFGVAVATLAFFAALFVMPLADATALIFTSPILTGLLSALFLGEPARRETWLATLLAFVGVLIVLRPNAVALGPAALLPLLSAAGMSLLMIGNRATAGSATPLAQQFYVAAIAAPLLVLAAVIGHVSGLRGFAVALPPASVVLRCAMVAVSASTAHWLIYRGTVLAGAATVAPMTYVQIVMASALGWLVFNHPPKPLTLLGVAVIAAAGLLLWRTGRMREVAASE